MGWSYTKKVAGKKVMDYIKEDMRPHVIKASRRVGKEVYLAVDIKGETVAVVCLIDTTKTEYGFKYMDESMGPYYTHCPKKILDMLSPTNSEYAIKWRNKCREFNKIKPGTVVRTKPISFKLRKESVGICDEFTFTSKKNIMLCSLGEVKLKIFNYDFEIIN